MNEDIIAFSPVGERGPDGDTGKDGATGRGGPEGREGREGRTGRQGEPGRSAGRWGIVGYIFMALGVVSALYFAQIRQDRQLRHDINHIARVGCLTSSRPFFLKHNAFVAEIIETRNNTARDHRRLGQLEEARIDENAIARYRTTFFPVPTIAQCKKPIL